ncbi:hypothetical protein [Streptomyces flavofungini]|uniref:hypothetical protein n=1 Tax=Streptomyces flavofungini TaxID=68200 RepID=UPI003F541108
MRRASSPIRMVCLVERLRTGAPVNPVRDHGLMYVGGEKGHTDCPALEDPADDLAGPAVPSVTR